ncbi:MAG: hypothetical protein AB1505_04980 [Candidatus Latescibacterota bacterium]
MHAQDAPPRFVQDRFAIGFWVDPPADERADERYAEVAAAHFNLTLALFGAPTRPQQERVLAVCQRYGLKAILPDAPDGQRADGPACWGYSLRDEPSVKNFAALRARVNELRSAPPGRLAYVNLYPGYATPEQLGAPTYDEYVRRYMETVDPDVLSMDYYPRFAPDQDGREAYCADLAVMRRHALRHAVPFWEFSNTMPYGPHTDPTEGQLRWQVFASLAYGARGMGRSAAANGRPLHRPTGPAPGATQPLLLLLHTVRVGVPQGRGRHPAGRHAHAALRPGAAPQPRRQPAGPDPHAAHQHGGLPRRPRGRAGCGAG